MCVFLLAVASLQTPLFLCGSICGSVLPKFPNNNHYIVRKVALSAINNHYIVGEVALSK